MTFRHDQQFFDTTDFVVFIITLLVPILIGIYYSFISKKGPKTISEYLVGNRNMGLFPVTMSLSASVISGYYLIGPISEVYFYGSQIILMSLCILLGSFFFATIYLPVFYNSKVISTLEYLESKFDYKVRFLGSVLFLIKTIVNMAVWIYAPVLMLEQVVGVNSNILVPIFSGICMFYTSGGVKSVIWADTFQLILMLLGLIIIVIVGVLDVGGIVKIWEISKEGKRLQVFDFDLDPRLRQSFWIFFVGSGAEHLAYFTASQFLVQRCVTVSTFIYSIYLSYSTLPLSIESCKNSTVINFVNETLETTSRNDQDESFFLYSISFHYYALIGTLTVIVVGMITSYFTGFIKPEDTDPKYFSPVIHRYLRRYGHKMIVATTNNN